MIPFYLFSLQDIGIPIIKLLKSYSNVISNVDSDYGHMNIQKIAVFVFFYHLLVKTTVIKFQRKEKCKKLGI